VTDTHRFRELDRLFQAVCDLPSHEREARLIELAPNDDTLRSEVLELLATESRAETADRLSSGAMQSELAQVLAGQQGEPAELAGYRILSRLGTGGMGVVYEAEQRSPKRLVALKVLRPGLATPDLIRRFEFEAQALGRLRHPGIAQVFEAGVASTPTGPRPFFAMELVRGVTLDRWAASRSVREKLEMMATICDAVQHAHAQGVLHRDLKPANILVTEEGQAKVLDFGVARAAEAEQRAETLQTIEGQIVGTLPYMSPELVGGDPAEVDTRSDVYALGVVLFELLSGRIPHEVTGKGLMEAARVIRDDEPTRLATLEPKMRGDIDTIVRTAIFKDKDRRYQTAQAMGEDIRRHLGGQTISARPASAVYQLSRLARRHKAAVAALIVMVLSVVAATVISTSALVREKDANTRLVAENANFEATITFLEGMLTKANANAGDETTLLDVLDAAAEQVRTGKFESAEVEASLRTTLGATYGWMSYYEDAVEMLEPALPIRMEINGPMDLATLDSRKFLTRFTALAGDPEKALTIMGDWPERFRPTVGDDPVRIEQMGDLLRAKAIALKKAGRTNEIEPVLTEAAVLFERLRLPDGTLTLGSLGEVFNELGTLRRSQNDMEGAERYYLKSMDVYKQVYGEDERYSSSLNNLAVVYRLTGRLDEAEAAIKRSLEISEAIYGDMTPGRVMTQRSNYGRLLVSRGKHAEAVPILHRALAEHREVLPEGHANIGYPLMNLAEALIGLEEFEEAEALASEAVELFSAGIGPQSGQVATALSHKADALAGEQRYAEAAAVCERAADVMAEIYGAADPLTIDYRFVHAARLAQAGQAERATEVLEAAVADASTLDEGKLFAYSVGMQGVTLAALGRDQEALGVLDRWLEIAQQSNANSYSFSLGEVARKQIELLQRAGRDEDAKTLAKLLAELCERALGSDHPRTRAFQEVTNPAG